MVIAAPYVLIRQEIMMMIQFVLLYQAIRMKLVQFVLYHERIFCFLFFLLLFFLFYYYYLLFAVLFYHNAICYQYYLFATPTTPTTPTTTRTKQKQLHEVKHEPAQDQPIMDKSYKVIMLLTHPLNNLMLCFL